MSSDAIDAQPAPSLLGSWLRFFGSTIGSKMMMAATGLGLSLFLVAHLGGNLTAYLGRETFNGYAQALHDNPPLLWFVRLCLFAGFPLHIFFAVRTAQQNAAARPVAYAAPPKTPVRAAATTMILSGAVFLAFFVYHLAHFTWRVTGPMPAELPGGRFDAYGMLVLGFQQPLIAGFYVLGQVLLGAHLSHGLYSLFQHLGLNGARWTPFALRGSLIAAAALCAAFASLPLAVMAGVIKP